MAVWAFLAPPKISNFQNRVRPLTQCRGTRPGRSISARAPENKRAAVKTARALLSLVIRSRQKRRRRAALTALVCFLIMKHRQFQTLEASSRNARSPIRSCFSIWAARLTTSRVSVHSRSCLSHDRGVLSVPPQFRW